MSLILAISFVLFISSTLGQTTEPFHKIGEFIYMQVKNGSKGFELNLNKLDHIIGNNSADNGGMDCELQCLRDENCLSGTFIDLNTEPPSYRCLMFNWSSSDFEKRLSSEANSVSFQLQVYAFVIIKSIFMVIKSCCFEGILMMFEDNSVNTHLRS